MQTETYFSVSEDIARRSGMIGQRYMTKDGRYILSDRDLRSLRLEPQEYINGIDAVALSRDEAKTAIAEGGYKMTVDLDIPEETPDTTEETSGVPEATSEDSEESENPENVEHETEGKEDDHE